MRLIMLLMSMLVVIGVFIYTLNYARWLWKKKLLRGSVGVAVLALLGLTVPLGLLFFVHH